MFDRFRQRWSRSEVGGDPGEQATAPENELALQADRPISNKAGDLFDRAAFAEQIARIVASRADPSSLVVGLYGPWGDGKTSTLSMIRETLEADPDIIPMDYNPWFYGDTTEQLTRSFFASIKAKLEGSGYFTRENIGRVMAGLGGVPYVGDGLKQIAEAVTTEALTDARDELGTILRRHRKKVVIFVDDIDRLDRAEIQTLFKLVRLSGGFDHTTYILAFDDSVVAEALGQAYGSGDPAAGRRFLEKIVQVPLHLPPVRPEKLRDLMFTACDRVLTANGIELSEGSGSELGSALATGFVHALKTPRQVKLLENGIGFALPLLKGEVRIIDQIQIEALRIFYPGIYEAVRKNPHSLLRARERRDEKAPSPVEDAIAALDGSADERKAVEDLLIGLFPRFGAMGYGDDWDMSWAADKRICSRDYFSRYFTYAVPTGDISDHIIDELIARAGEADVSAVEALFAEGYAKNAAELMIRKLRSREETLPLSAVATIIGAVSAKAAAIPITRDLLLGDFVFRQASILVTRLAARMTPDEQDRLLASVVRTTDSLFFADLIVRRSLAKPQNLDDRSSIPKARVEPLGAILLARLRSLHAEGKFFSAVEPVNTLIYAVEQSGSEAVKRELRDLLGQVLVADAGNALRFVKAFAGRSQGGDGIIRVSDVDNRAYRTLASFVDAEEIVDQLKRQFGDDIGQGDWPDSDDHWGDDDRRVAAQFAYQHLHPPSPGDEGAE